MKVMKLLVIGALAVGLNMHSAPLEAMHIVKIEEEQEQQGLKAWIESKMHTFCASQPSWGLLVNAGLFSVNALLFTYLMWHANQEHDSSESFFRMSADDIILYVDYVGSYMHLEHPDGFCLDASEWTDLLHPMLKEL